MEFLLYGAAGVTSLGYGLYRCLNMSEETEVPQLVHTDPASDHIKYIINACPILKEQYKPPETWGKNGHLQTIVSSKLRFNSFKLEGDRHYLKVSNGATLSFDIYEPVEDIIKDDVTMLICPGFSNNSESKYVSSFAHSAVARGYRVIIMNHLGTLNEPLTSPRIFTYGSTEELHALVDWIVQVYVGTTIIAIGFSMGANILVKFLGENEDNQRHFRCCLSLQQGYDIDLAVRHLFVNRWIFRLYTFALATKYKQLIKKHYKALFQIDSTKEASSLWKLMTTTSLLDVDTKYMCKMAGFSNVVDYYQWSSSSRYINNIKIPMLCLNAEDDPICPEDLLKIPAEIATKKDNCLFVKTKHGGHLGYFEGGFFVPNKLTWCDRLILQYADAIRALNK